MNFEYSYSQRAEADIEIEDPYNCVIKTVDHMGKVACVLYIKTTLGETQIIEYGPVLVSGEDVLPKSVKYTFDRINFSESKIIGRISKFLNNPANKVFQADEVQLEDVYDLFYNLIEKVT